MKFSYSKNVICEKAHHLKSKYLPFFYYYRREEGMCRQCFSAATLTDVILGGKNTKGLIKVQQQLFLKLSYNWDR